MGFSPKSDLKMAVAHVKLLCQTPKNNPIVSDTKCNFLILMKYLGKIL